MINTESLILLFFGLLVISLCIIAVISKSKCNKNGIEFQYGDSGCVNPVYEKWTVDKSTPIKYGTIFVSIPSYRDSECRDTVYNMFEKAKNPNMIYAGIVQQNKADKKEEDCFDKCPDCKKRKETGHIKVKNFDFKDAKGPCFARYEASKLWNGEEFYMEIDSHTDFLQDWDEILLSELKATQDPKAVIGSYPPTPEQMEKIKNGKKEFPMMCTVFINEDNLPQVKAKMVQTPSDELPVPVAFIGSNLKLMPYQALFDVPYDPHLNFLFFGEELLHSARLWTSGYNLYAPVKSVATHKYGRQGSPKFWNDLKKYEKCRLQAIKRVKYMLKLNKKEDVSEDFSKELDYYGLGDKRSIDSYWKFLDVDLKNEKAKSNCDANGYKNKN